MDDPKDQMLLISNEDWAELVELMGTAAREAAPGEACGLLWGPAGQAQRITAAVRVPNVGGGAGSFALEPGAWRTAEVEAEVRGLELRGFWHTHPSGRPTPSSRDAAAAWSGSLHGIATCSGELAFFRRHAGEAGTAGFRRLAVVEPAG